MAKKPRRTRRKVVEGLKNLTSPEKLEQQTAEITEAADIKNKVQKTRPINPNKNMRKEYSIMADPELIKQMKIRAIQQNMTIADLLEKLMKDYLK